MLTPSFVGRDSELGAILTRLEKAADGQQQLVFIQGEAGIGKTALLGAALEEAERRGFRVFSGRCEELERSRSFAPLREALGLKDALLSVGELVEAVDGVPSSLEGGSHFRVVEAIGDRLEAEATRGPIALAVEDLQWSDPSTIYTLRSVAKRLRYQPVVVAVTFRPLPKRDDLEHLLERSVDEGALSLTLPSLTEGSVAEFVATALGAHPSEDLLQTAREAGGNPLFLAEFLDALMREGAIEIEEGRATLLYATLPPDLRIALLQRIAFLSEEALELLRVGAILGTTFLPGDLTAAAGKPLVELMVAVDEWRRAGLVEEEGASLRFRHDLIREALYQDISEGLRSRLHLEVARSLQLSGATLDRVADHYSRGATTGDEEASAVIRRAAEARSAHPETKIQLLRRALELSADQNVKDGIGVELSEALVWGGRAGEAESAARELLRTIPDQSMKARLREVVLRALRFSARWPELASTAREWRAAREFTVGENAYLLAIEAYARAWVDPPPLTQVLSFAEQALDDARRSGDKRAEFTALSALNTAYSRLPSGGEGMLDAAQRMMAIAEDDADGYFWSEHPHIQLGTALLSTAMTDPQRVEEAERVLSEGLRLRQRVGTLWELPLYHNGLALLRIYQRRYDDAIAEAEASLSLAEEGGTEMGVVWAHELLALASLFDDDLAEAKKQAALARQRAGKWKGDSAEALNVRTILASIVGTKKESAEAHKEYLGLFRNEPRPPVSLEGVRAFLDVGWRDQAEEWVGFLEATTIEEDQMDRHLRVRAARAMLEDNLEEMRRLADLTQELKPWHSAIWEELAVMEAAHGFSEEAKRRAARALDALLEDQVPRWRIEQFTARLKPYGIRIGPKSKRRRQGASGWDSLTESEMRVVELASIGLTNPEIAERLFLSRHTVVSHLSHVFAKLGIVSRVELAAEVARRRIGAAGQAD